MCCNSFKVQNCYWCWLKGDPMNPWGLRCRGWYGLYLFLVPWGAMRLSRLGTSVTSWLTVPAPDDDERGAIGGIIDKGNRSTRRKSLPLPFCRPQIPNYLILARTRTAGVGSQQLTSWAIARHRGHNYLFIHSFIHSSKSILRGWDPKCLATRWVYEIEKSLSNDEQFLFAAFLITLIKEPFIECHVYSFRVKKVSRGNYLMVSTISFYAN
jgi:hypothetical protein